MKERSKTRNMYGLESGSVVRAISEDMSELIQYKNQFPDYFADGNVCHYKTIKARPEDINHLQLVWLTNDIIVTQWEHDYYTKQFKESYKNTKSMMSQMLILIKTSNFTIEEKSQMKKTFDMIYGHIKCYDDFVSHLDTDVIRSQYLVNPDMCMRMKNLDESYRLAVDKED